MGQGILGGESLTGQQHETAWRAAVPPKQWRTCSLLYYNMLCSLFYCNRLCSCAFMGMGKPCTHAGTLGNGVLAGQSVCRNAVWGTVDSVLEPLSIISCSYRHVRLTQRELRTNTCRPAPTRTTVPARPPPVSNCCTPCWRPGTQSSTAHNRLRTTGRERPVIAHVLKHVHAPACMQAKPACNCEDRKNNPSLEASPAKPSSVGHPGRVTQTPPDAQSAN